MNSLSTVALTFIWIAGTVLYIVGGMLTTWILERFKISNPRLSGQQLIFAWIIWPLVVVFLAAGFAFEGICRLLLKGYAVIRPTPSGDQGWMG